MIRSMKTIEDSDYEVPVTLKKVMREYQKDGFRWMKTLLDHGFGGILADDMGLGKTLQVISVLLSERAEPVSYTHLGTLAFVLFRTKAFFNYFIIKKGEQI